MSTESPAAPDHKILVASENGLAAALAFERAGIHVTGAPAMDLVPDVDWFFVSDDQIEGVRRVLKEQGISWEERD